MPMTDDQIAGYEGWALVRRVAQSTHKWVLLLSFPAYLAACDACDKACEREPGVEHGVMRLEMVARGHIVTRIEAGQ
jgi:hypothetical protein